MREKIIDLMNNKGDLPPLPDVLVKLQQIIDDPRTGIPDIVKILEMDPVLAAKIMSVSNSVHYTRGAGASKTLLMAVNKIGRNELLKIVYSIELSKMFSDNRIMDYTDFWKHCLSVAVMTQSLCKRLNFEEDYLDIAYLTGLLHDVGIMVFAYLVPDEYKNFLSATQGDDEESFERQEINTFGIDHSELGGMFISKWWDLDDRISQAIKYHHFPYPEEKMLS
ncbi:MAG: HDOD domain-containing protein, partial [bacterium]|nr:HDOD domain-containing protein [bacterium]